MGEAQRLADLETTVAFQERLLAELNQALVDQQAQIDRLVRQLQELLDERAATPLGDPEDEPPPPHY